MPAEALRLTRIGGVLLPSEAVMSCCAGAAFFWGWRFQQFSRGPKRALYGWSLPVAKACGNAMKIAVWPVLILPLSYVFTTPLRCALNEIQHRSSSQQISGCAGGQLCR